MPTHEAIQATLIPKAPEAPIPVRTVSTKPARLQPVAQNTTQQTPGETIAAESAPVAESITLSPQASAKARQEQAYRQREAVLKQREADLELKLKDAEQFAQLKAKLASKDFKAAEELGINYDDYTAYQMAKQEGEPSEEVKAVKALQSEVESLKKGQEEKAAKEYDSTVAAYRKEITALVAADPEFSSIKELGHEESVLQLILDSWEEDSTEMTVAEAAKDIETYLVEEATKMANLTKVRPKVDERKLPLPKPGLKTLTQQVSVGATPPNTKPLSQMSDSERYAEARRRALAKREGK